MARLGLWATVCQFLFCPIIFGRMIDIAGIGSINLLCEIINRNLTEMYYYFCLYHLFLFLWSPFLPPVGLFEYVC